VSTSNVNVGSDDESNPSACFVHDAEPPVSPPVLIVMSDGRSVGFRITTVNESSSCLTAYTVVMPGRASSRDLIVAADGSTPIVSVSFPLNENVNVPPVAVIDRPYRSRSRYTSHSDRTFPRLANRKSGRAFSPPQIQSPSVSGFG